MKLKSLLLMALLGLASSNLLAQESTLSINVAYGPMGNISASLAEDDAHKIKYDALQTFNLGIEKQLSGVSTLFDFAYGKASLNDYDIASTSTYPLTGAGIKDEVTYIGAMMYFGHTINKKKRLQIPLYFGLGCDYLNGAPYHNLFFGAGVKARIKFYISSHIGIFADVSGKYSVGTRSVEGQSESVPMRSMMWYPTAGVTFSI